MANKVIEPLKVYNSTEVAKLLDMDEQTIYKEVKVGNLVGRKAGKGLKFLGENIMSYLGSPTISRMKLDK